LATTHAVTGRSCRLPGRGRDLPGPNWLLGRWLRPHKRAAGEPFTRADTLEWRRLPLNTELPTCRIHQLAYLLRTAQRQIGRESVRCSRSRTTPENSCQVQSEGSCTRFVAS